MRVAWAVELEGEPTARPTADETRVFLVTVDGRVWAFARTDGGWLWTTAVDAHGEPVAAGAILMLATSAGVTALRAVDGALVWRTTGAPAAAAPSVANDRVLYGTTGGEMVALHARDGAEVWRRSLGSSVTGPAALEGSHAYVPLEDGRVVALGVATGDVTWERRLDGRPDGVVAAPEAIYVGATDNYLYSLSARDGRVLWRWRTAADIVATPALDARRIYVASLDNVLRALDRRSGVLQWARPIEGRHLGPPQVVGDLLVAPAPQAVVLFYARATGRPVAGLNLPAPLAIGLSRVEPGPSGASFFFVILAPSGRFQLSAAAPGEDPPLAPLVELPGQPLEPEPAPARPGSADGRGFERQAVASHRAPAASTGRGDSAPRYIRYSTRYAPTAVRPRY